MAHRTTKRAGIYTETGKGSAVANVQKSKGISIVTKFKGLQDNKNDVVAVQDSLADVDNLYIDDNDLLSSRPPVKLYTPVHNEFASDKCHSIRMWNVEGYIFRLIRKVSTVGLDNYIRYDLVCDNKIPDSTVSDGSETYYSRLEVNKNLGAEYETEVSFAPIEDKIFICMSSNSWGYFNTKNYRFYTLSINVDDFVYIPIRYNIVNGVYKEFEALNYLTETYRNRYHYGMGSSVDFGQLDRWVRVYNAIDEKYPYQLDTDLYPNKNISSVLVYPLAFADTPDYYDVVEREDGPVIMCWYESTSTIKISLDGKTYFTLSNFPTGDMINSYSGGHPYLSKDGNTVIVCMVEGIYFASLFNLEAGNYRTFEKHLYLENAMQEDGILYNDGEGVELYGVSGFIAYFYSETVYAYKFWTLTGLVDVFAGICVSHMRDTQKIDFIDMSYDADPPINSIADKICMCPRYLDYIYSSGGSDFTPGPIIMYTDAFGISVDCITYTTQHDSIDDITGFNVTSLSSVFDTVYTSDRNYIDICMSAQPNYYTDSYDNKQVDVELTAAYRAGGQSNYLILTKGYINRSNAYTRLKRARSDLQTGAGTPAWISVSTSLSRVFWSMKWGDNSVTQHYYHWDDLPYSAPPIVPETISSYVPDYIVPVNLPAKIVAYGGKENLWALKDNTWWTTELFTDTVLYLDTYVGATGDYGPTAYVTKAFSHFTALQEYYFSFGNTLAVTATRRNDNNEFLLYLPVDDTQECISEITNLCPISTQYVGVFLEDSIWYAGMEYLNNALVHKKLMKSKIPFGCKKGTDILVASDGQSIIFPTYRGIALLGPQDFVATTDPIINYISDNIQNFYLRFYSEVMFAPYKGRSVGIPYYNIAFERKFAISFVTYKYWMFMYKRYCREILLYDMRDSTWWTWTMPYPVVDMVFADRLYALLHTAEKGISYNENVTNTSTAQRLCDLFVVADKEADLGYALENFPRIDPSIDDFEYEDELIPNTLNGDVKVVKDDSLDGSHVELPLPQSRIDWFLISQKLYLGALNNYKSITGINIVAKGLYEYGTKLTVRVFRNVEHPEDSIDMDIFIKDLRTFVQRLNLMHAIFFQYKLNNTDEDKQRQAHIASLCVKYETKEAIR